MESEGSSSSVFHVKSQISTYLCEEDFKACKSGLTNKHIDGSKIMFRPSQGRDRAGAENKQSRYLKSEIKMFQHSAAQHISAEETGQVPPFWRSQDYCNPCDWSSSHGTLSDKYDVRLSETCQRKFVMFDLEHSRSKKTIFLHPATIDEISQWLPHDSSNLEEHIDHLHSLSVRAMSHLKERMIIPSTCGFSQWDSSFKFHQQAQSMMCKDTDINFIDVQGYNEEVKLKYDDEDSKDIEALLCSDDETSSTGHSPSYSICPNLPHFIYDDGGGLNQVDQFSKRTKEMEFNDTRMSSSSSSSGGALADLDEYSQSVDFPLNENKNMVLGHCRGGVVEFYVTKTDDLSTSSSRIKRKLFSCQRRAKRTSEEKAKHTLHHIRRAWNRQSSGMLRLCKSKSVKKS